TTGTDQQGVATQQHPVFEISIDVAWIVDDQVLATDTLDPCTLTDQSQCPRWTSPAPVDALLEVPAGALDGIEPGTHVTIREDQP
ncbi:DUF192 domain-containing protein, partial [Corynebacterium sanguinis]|uniref:DUF192 domain-containing protein n=1 Tax=Corynebacterium sanguinis TaxID=2594913 RepID=UPI00223A9AFA|nr:DUF192 domain-containing protein [Corynebacterium sanguinis]